VSPLAPGEAAPAVDGIDFRSGPTALLFYKVTCPVCQLAAPVVQRLHQAIPGKVKGVGQDPPPMLAEFARTHGMDVPAIPDEPPYPLSDAYEIRVVPTLFVIATDGTIAETVESWDRDGYNAAAAMLAELSGTAAITLSEQSDGRPPFRPG
jgi:peroxiredoxin